ncbi:MAG: hypothetical protein ABWZ15_05970, partial [Acidimicrobiia bacterium]
ATANHEDVELLGGQAAQCVGAVERHPRRLPGSSSRDPGRKCSHHMCAITPIQVGKRAHHM